MLKTILLIIATVVAALLAYAAFKPDSFRLSRSATIAAPPDRVFALINDLRRFNEWNPFAKMEPTVAITYGASSAGVGGAYNWKGEKTGEGRMQITESVPAQRVTAKLDFSKPLEAHNMVDFTVQPQGSGSTVTWAMHGPMPYLNRLMTAFFDIRLFGNGRVVHTQHWSEGTPYPAGSVMAVSFELHGQPLIAFNGGPHVKLNEAASLFVQCDDQAEVDKLWDGLIADGGAPSQCGWLKDRFGLSWQIVPKAHMQMMSDSDSDSARVARVVQAMMKMSKFDIAALQRAYDGA